MIWREDLCPSEWTSHATLFVYFFLFFFCFFRGTFFWFWGFFYYLASGWRVGFLFCFFFNRITFEIFWPENFIALREAAQRRDERLRTLTLISTLTGMQHRDTREASRLIKTPCVTVEENLCLIENWFSYFMFSKHILCFPIIAIFYFTPKNFDSKFNFCLDWLIGILIEINQLIKVLHKNC